MSSKVRENRTVGISYWILSLVLLAAYALEGIKDNPLCVFCRLQSALSVCSVYRVK